MMASHATHVDGGFATEPGLLDMDVAMRAGRFKVNEYLNEWFQEYRLYHRDEKTGQIIKKGDDLMSATRIAWMSRRHATIAPLGGKRIVPRRPQHTEDIDPWSGRPVRREQRDAGFGFRRI